MFVGLEIKSSMELRSQAHDFSTKLRNVFARYF
jgi:hypothetical protein